MKKFLALALVLVVVAGVLPVTASAAADEVAYAVEGGNIYFDPSTGEITDADSKITSAVIPAEIDGVAVTSIRYEAFRGCRSLTSIEIPSSVTSIGTYAFQGCTSLGSIAIPSSVTYLGQRAFDDCDSLTSVTISESVERISHGAFAGCNSLTSVTIPSSVTSIDGEAFQGCSLASIAIPSSVTSIGERAFSRCTSLTNVAGADNLVTLGDDAFEKTPWLAAQGEFAMLNSVLAEYQGNGGDVAIPSSVTSIGEGAFGDCDSLTSITIPSSVTSIGDRAFDGCTSLGSITIPSSVARIGVMAFFDCDSLKTVTIPEGVTSIGTNAFGGCNSLTSIEIPSSVTDIGEYAFQSCRSLESVTILGSLTHIRGNTFVYCTSLTSITIPSSVTSIEYNAFQGCDSLTSITVPSSVASIGGTAFEGCDSLTNVYYGGSEAEWQAIAIDNKHGFNDRLLNATIHYATPPTETADLAIANTQTVLVDGESVTFETYALEVEGGVTNYIKLRDLAYVLNGTAAQFEVAWDGAVNILDGQSYTPNGSEMNTPFSGDRAYRPTDAVTKVDGVETPFDAICLEDDDGGEYNYYKLRDLGAALGFDVSWDSEGKYIYIETDQPYTDD